MPGKHRAPPRLTARAEASVDDLIPEAELSEETGWSVPTLRTWRSLRKGPPYIAVGRRIWYRRSSYNQWLLKHERITTQ
jgi:hypothetical protein